ncbi:hypothetical protein CICLE_v10006852mg [Citrus x clementina]|uniref:Bis(5'-adenosyl)-triphosphatase n=1 Tax=Citrus clementina TaxID=85681 RepID=V4SCA3_CITCL|nr:hypothetical protein CICLE_v10006852mg [Citrus x clementina]
MSSTTQFTFGPYKIDAKEVFYSTPLSYAMVNLRPLLPDNSLMKNRGRRSPRYTGPKMKPTTAATRLPFYEVVYGFFNLCVVHHEHVLVCSRREAKRFADLTADETTDLWLTAQKVGKQLESYHKGSSTTFAIQDGPEAGQTVPHVHIHVLPRKAGDFEKNDEIYDAIEVKEKELQQKLDLDKERKDRSLEEMNQEADQYRSLFL